MPEQVQSKLPATMMSACYSCKHRGTLMGDCHSRCLHPVTKAVSKDGDLMSALISILSDGNAINRMATKLEIRASQHGVQAGWFHWPCNFDPVWLEHCEGFETAEGLNWVEHNAELAKEDAS